jgi:phosphoribosyl 1,2-cyclic phosphodiesterase
LEREFSGRPIRAHIFFSHFHLDHIQGVPFFKPLYDPRNHFTFYFAGRQDANFVVDALAGMMANPYFPVDMSNLPCSREYVDLVEGTFSVADISVTVLSLNHPQGCVGYRIAQNGKVLSYCTDVEHGVDWSDRNIRILARDADLLIVDSQFTPDQLAKHTGWGHSSWTQSLEMGIEAGARKIALYHHDPYHEDAALDEIQTRALSIFPNVIAAREGLEVRI